MKEAGIDLDGVVSEVLPSAMFRVDLDNGHKVLATTAGKMRSSAFASWPAIALPSPSRRTT